MRLALVGCGFVADYYLQTLPLHPELEVVGLYDRQLERAHLLSRIYGVPSYGSLEALLGDPSVELVLNLTNPRDHHEISRRALEVGKHVYSEKPLAMAMEDARGLVALAREKGLEIGGAPCSALSETAQTMWRALRKEIVGPVRLVYAEMDDGLVHRMAYRKWLSTSGLPWPYKDEFEVGCTLEHAGYCLSWLSMWFGPATSVTAFGSTQIPDKVPGEALNMDSPDFSVACVQFESGVVARLTCSIVAPHDHRLMVVGDRGILCTHDTWDYQSPVYSRRLMRIRRRTFLNPLKRPHRLAKAPYGKADTRGAQTMDFARGPAEMAAALREGRPSRVGADFSLHVNEMALAIHHARTDGARYAMTTRFEPVAPMPWAT